MAQSKPLTATPAVYKTGYVTGLIAFFAAAAYVIVQMLQVSGMLQFPADEILIYGTSLCIVIPYLMAMLAFHYITPAEKKYWSHTALLFAVLYAVYVTANYVVQLATVVPAKLDGTIEKIRLLDQYPHSLFWNFDAMGYIFMGLATFAAIPALNQTGFEKNVRLAFLANTLVTPLISIVYFYPDFSNSLLMLGLPWGITAPFSMLMLALLFKNQPGKLIQIKK